jgi:hypothetical protein
LRRRECSCLVTLGRALVELLLEIGDDLLGIG